jgi:small subunit ribosomal protein S6e
MANFQFIVSDPTKRKAYKVEVDQDKAVGIVGKIIGEKFNGDILGLSGYELQITGGTDKDGFPMHPQVHGPGRKKILLSNRPGFHPLIKGQRKRKMVRGSTISADIIQVNCKITKAGTTSLDSLFKKESKEEQPREEAKQEEKKPEEKPKEVKTEKKEEKKS